MNNAKSAADYFVPTLRANVDNPDLSDADFRQMIRNCLPSLEGKEPEPKPKQIKARDFSHFPQKEAVREADDVEVEEVASSTQTLMPYLICDVDSKEYVINPDFTFNEDFRVETPGLHRLYVEWATGHLAMINKAIYKFNRASNLNMLDATQALIEARNQMILKSASNAEAMLILHNFGKSLNKSCRVDIKDILEIASSLAETKGTK